MDLPVSLDDIKRAVKFISDNLKNAEWLIIYPGVVSDGRISITHGQLVTNIPIATSKDGKTLYHLFDFIKDIVPLGLDLLQLQNIANFVRLVQKLNVHSHERSSAMLETFIAADALRSGYEVELEPSNGKGGLCDLKIGKIGQDDIYIECKALNSHESELYQIRQDFVQQLGEYIFKKTVSDLPAGKSIVVKLPDNYRKMVRTDSWLNDVISSIKDNQFDVWKQIDGVQYRIHTGRYDGTLPARYFMSGCGRTPGWFDVQIISAMGNASSRLKKIIKEAKNQLAVNQKGIIILQTQYTDILPGIARERLAREDYRNVISIVGVDVSHKTTIIKNVNHSKISCSFLETEHV
jgi:hypothetical protein